MVSIGHCALNAWGRTDLNRLLGQVVPGYIQSVGTGMTSGATSITSSTTAIPLSYGFVRKGITDNTGYTTGTLANGTPGQMLTILISADEGAGSGTFTLTPTTTTGFTSIYFNAVYDQVTLLYVDDSAGWIIVSYESVTFIR
jgi:hypothetical protein